MRKVSVGAWKVSDGVRLGPKDIIWCKEVFRWCHKGIKVSGGVRKPSDGARTL